MKGWLVNDTLTCIPGTKTFWHDLLENIPGLIDMTGGYTDFGSLPIKIEREVKNNGAPDYIIRNATFFRKMNLPCKQLSLLQDIYTGQAREQQIDVCNNSEITIFNSKYTYENYRNEIKSKVKIISLGIDFDLFKPSTETIPEILPNSILYVGSSANYPKGFNTIINLIDTTNYNFCLVMKDDYKLFHPRVRVYNMVSHDMLVKIYNSCGMLICTSITETQHLASIEAGACNLPVLTTDIRALYNEPDGDWGLKVKDNNYIEKIDYILNNKDKFSPRQFFLNKGFNKKDCMNSWKTLIENLY